MPGRQQPTAPDGTPARTGHRWVQASATADAAVQARLDALLAALLKLAGDDLVAVVVGGSLARGEGAVLAGPEGSRLLSDIDLFAVVESNLHVSTRDLDAAARRVVAGDPFLSAPLDLGIIDRGWFGRVGATLPAFQLAAGFQVVWERDARWQRPLPPQGPVEVDDALRLLHNRFAESLLYRARAARTPPDPFALFHRWKVWYDAPLAWLAATGAYHPDRAVQVQRLEVIAQELPSSASEWLRAGARRCADLRAAILTAPLDAAALRQMGAGAAPAADGSKIVVAADVELLRWAWPFWRAAMVCSMGSSDPSSAAGLARAFEAGGPFAGDLGLAGRWLRRRGPMARVREARRWAPLSGRRLTPWWRHGPGGCGPDRMYAAIALRFGGLAEWDRPLRGLVQGGSRGWATQTGDGADAWLAELWSGWIMGGARR